MSTTPMPPPRPIGQFTGTLVDGKQLNNSTSANPMYRIRVQYDDDPAVIFTFRTEPDRQMNHNIDLLNDIGKGVLITLDEFGRLLGYERRY